MPKPRLLIATRNQGKIREYQRLLATVSYSLIGLDDAGLSFDVEETGQTFADNAILKATTYARASGLLTLADDSGLAVDALGGEPGVRSSRYAGPDAGDPERIAFLLDKLAAVPPSERTARFHCVIALAHPSGELITVDGICEGIITQAARGSGGFGYDPVFYLPDQGCTMAELSPEEKNLISHRARAAHKVCALLPDLASTSKTHQNGSAGHSRR